MKYMTQEWYELLKEKVNTDTDHLKKTRGLTVKFQTLATDAPGGVDKLVTWDVERGKIRSIIVEEKPAPSDWRTMQVDLAKYVLMGTGSYETYCGIHRKDFIPFIEVLKKGFKMQGDLVKIMSSMMSEFVQLLEYQSSVPAEY